MRAFVAGAIGFVLVAGGLFLLAFSQVSNVVPDPEAGDLSGLTQGTVVSETAGVILSAVLVTAGVGVILAYASAAHGWRKAAALSLVSTAFILLLVAHTLLFTNGVQIGGGSETVFALTSSYLFHTGDDLTFAAAYIIFFFTLALLIILFGSVAYLLMPVRVAAALADKRSWTKNEAAHTVASLFLVANLIVLVPYLVRVASGTNARALRQHGLWGDTLVPLYYLMGIMLAGLAVLVAVHAFVLNWGHRLGQGRPTLADSLETWSRVERVVGAAALVLATVLLLGPELPTQVTLSRTAVFNISPRGLAYTVFLFLLPYLPYAFTQQRLLRLLASGGAPRGPLFSHRTLRLTAVHLAGTLVILGVGVFLSWTAFALLATLAAWTAGAFCVQALRVESGNGLPRVGLRPDVGAPFYLGFLGLAVTVGLMLWGAGNTFEAAYSSDKDQLSQLNESTFGLDIVARVAAAFTVSLALLLTLDVWRHAMGVRRRFLIHYLALFLSCTIMVIVVFSVGVWSTGAGGLRDAYTGYAFHEYYAQDKILAGVLLGGTLGYVFFAVGRIMKALRAPAVATATIQVAW